MSTPCVLLGTSPSSIIYLFLLIKKKKKKNICNINKSQKKLETFITILDPFKFQIVFIAHHIDLKDLTTFLSK